MPRHDKLEHAVCLRHAIDETMLEQNAQVRTNKSGGLSEQPRFEVTASTSDEIRQFQKSHRADPYVPDDRLAVRRFAETG